MGGRRQSAKSDAASTGKPTWASAKVGMERMNKTLHSRVNPDTGVSSRPRPHTVVGRADILTRGMRQMPSFEDAKIAARNKVASDMLNNRAQVYVHDRCSYDTLLSSYEPAALQNPGHASSERNLPLLNAYLPAPTPNRDKNGPWEGSPEGWEERMDGRGRLYYVSNIDKAISWEHPTKGKMEAMARMAPVTKERSTSSMASSNLDAGAPYRDRKTSILAVKTPGDAQGRKERGSVKWQDPSSPPPTGASAAEPARGPTPGPGGRAQADFPSQQHVEQHQQQQHQQQQQQQHRRSVRYVPLLQYRNPPKEDVGEAQDGALGREGGLRGEERRGSHLKGVWTRSMSGNNSSFDQAALLTTTSSSLGWQGNGSEGGGRGTKGGFRVHGHLALAMRLNHPDASIRVKGFPKGVAVITPHGLLDRHGELLPAVGGSSEEVWSEGVERQQRGPKKGFRADWGRDELRIKLHEWLLSPIVQRYRASQQESLKLPPSVGRIAFSDALEETRAALDSGQISKEAFMHIKDQLLAPGVELHRRAPGVNTPSSPPRRIPPRPEDLSTGGPWAKESRRLPEDIYEEDEGDHAWMDTTYRRQLKSPWIDGTLQTDYLPVAGMASSGGQEVSFPGTRTASSTTQGSLKANKPPQAWESRGIRALMYDAAYADEARNVPTNSHYGAEHSDRYAPDKWLSETTVLRMLKTGAKGELPEQYEKSFSGRR